MALTATASLPTAEDLKALIPGRYDRAIGYYWKTSRYNNRACKTTRYFTIFLGALVTLISSLQSAEFVKNAHLTTVFAVTTPLLAACLAIVGGISQAFQWGAAWSDMTMTATRLEKERDRVLVTGAGGIDAAKEIAVLNDLVVTETQGFFQRLFGSASVDKAEKA